MNKKKVVVWGGTGNFKVLCELLAEQYTITRFFDNYREVGVAYDGVPYLGTREKLEPWLTAWPDSEKPSFIVSIGPGHGRARLEIHDELKRMGLLPLTAIHRTAFVAHNAEIGEGSQVYAGALVCVHAKIGSACIINTGASVDHECVIESGATIGPGAVLAGLVHVGKNADVYTGAVILPRVTIGEDAIVGAGAVVLKDVPPGAVVVGNPARIIKSIK